MKQKFELIVVMAIGPNSKLEYILDTLISFQFYTTCTYKIIIIDNSLKDISLEIKAVIPDIDILKINKISGTLGGLYINLALAFKHAIQNYHFDALMKTDDDALFIGESPEKEAIRLFKENPKIGIAGLHVRGLYPLDFAGNAWDNNYPRKTLLVATCSWKILKRPVANFALRQLFLKAFYNGYDIGEYIFGGTYFFSELYLTKLNEAGYLPVYKLKNAILGDDHLFSLMAKVVGMEMGDLASGNLPLGLFWKTLPASPEMLLQKNKKVIHSTRKWENMNEDDVRGYFKKLRQKAEKPTATV